MHVAKFRWNFSTICSGEIPPVSLTADSLALGEIGVALPREGLGFLELVGRHGARHLGHVLFRDLLLLADKTCRSGAEPHQRAREILRNAVVAISINLPEIELSARVELLRGHAKIF